MLGSQTEDILEEFSSIDSENLRRRLATRAVMSSESKDKIRDYASWRCAAFCMPIGLFLSISAFILVFTLDFLPTNVILQEHLTMYNDWKAQPYIDILLEKHELGCPSEYEALFWRPWNGTQNICKTYKGNYSVLNDRDSSCFGEVM